MARTGAANRMVSAIREVKGRRVFRQSCTSVTYFLMRAWTLCLSAIAILACTPVADPQLPPSAAQVDDTEQVLRAHYTGVTSRQRLVIRDAQAWSEFWEQVHSNVMPQPPVPSIDFARNIVVAAAMGTRPTGGFSIQIDDVYTDEEELYAVVEERSPGGNCILTQALTAPVVAVRVPRVAASVSFVERRETFTC